MTLDKDLLQKSVEWTYIKLDFKKELIDKYISTETIDAKREITLDIFDHIHKKYFSKFDNSFQFFVGLKNFEEEFLYKYLQYRDHFIHSFQVFLLGCYLVEKANTESMPIEFLSVIDPKRFIKTWFLIAFYHDIGYIVEKLILIGKSLQEKYFNKISGLGLKEFKLNISDKLNSIFKDYLKFLTKGLASGEEKFFILKTNSFDDLKIEIMFNELEEGFKLRDHGVIGSLFLYYTIYLDIDFVINKNIREAYKDDLNIACSAIATHSIEKKGAIHLDFNNNPFACLLILCDNLQEWNRPTVKELQYIEYDIWEALNIEIDTKSEVFKLKFTLNESVTKSVMVDVLNFCFTDLKRIFMQTFIKGHHFLFEFSNNNISYIIEANFMNNTYEIKDKLE